MTPSDHQLLNRFLAQRDDAAFRLLVERHLPLVHGVARRTTQGREDLAWDATQEAFIRLARNAASVPPQVDLGAWLHRLARHAAVDLVRSETRRKKREETASQAMSASHPSSSGDDPAAWAELAPVVDELIDRLPAADRDLVIARYFRDESHTAIAGRLGVTEAVIRKRASRALEKLRSLLLRRGIATSAAALASLLPAHAASTPAPPALMTAVAGAVQGIAPLPASGFTAAHLAMSTAQKSAVAAAALIFLASAGYSLRPDASPATAFTVNPPPSHSASGIPSPRDRGRQVRRLPASAEERRERLREIVALPDRIDRSREMLAFLDLLSPSKYRETVECLKELAAPAPLAQPETDLALQTWAKVEPQAVAEWLQQQNSTVDAGVMKVWGEVGPEAALAWIASHHPEFLTPDPERSDSDPFAPDPVTSDRIPYVAVLAGWAAHDPAAVCRTLERDFPDPALRKKVVTELTRLLGSQPDALKRLTEVMPQGEDRAKVLEESLHNLCEADPQRGLKLLLADSGFRTSGNLGTYFSIWSDQDPQSASAGLETLPPGELQDAAAGSVASMIARQNLPEAVNILNRYPGGAIDEIIDYVAAEASSSDYAGTWDALLRLENEKGRDRALAKSIGQFAPYGPGQVQAWMASRSLSPALREKLQALLPAPSR